ncbi:beta-microseminoprotein A1-like [Antedon mediterranea]|uniref:beta-microseminoprotein A1-like n=1 Tax=Antedon mediterranea TaxID=105859 RepID=UPI003AF4164D
MRTSVCLLISLLSFLMIAKVRSMECEAAFDKYACKYGNEEYALGDQWKTKDCKECNCHGAFSICCTLVPKYFDWFDPPKGCRFIWDEAECKSRAVDEFDENKPCPDYDY